MRSSDAFLLDIVEASARISEYTAGMSRADFMADRKTQAAVVREIEIIGEASRQLPEPFKQANAAVPWRELARLRNMYIHAYHGVDYGLVWQTAVRTMPTIAGAVGALLPPDAATDEG